MPMIPQTGGDRPQKRRSVALVWLVGVVIIILATVVAYRIVYDEDACGASDFCFSADFFVKAGGVLAGVVWTVGCLIAAGVRGIAEARRRGGGSAGDD